MKFFLILVLFSSFSQYLWSQVDPSSIIQTENSLNVPRDVSDKMISGRIEKILSVPGWYGNLEITVKEGIVVLSGEIDSQEKKKWAFEVIKKTQGVVAIVDRSKTTIEQGDILSPAKNEITEIYSKGRKQLPYIISSLIILFIFILGSFFIMKSMRAFLLRRNKNALLSRSLANFSGLIIIILGVYFALKTSGLSTLAVTLLGGSGMLGIGLGLALKNTFENYTSSVMISLKELFKMGEVVEIQGFEGVVQSVTTRGTTLMDFDGNNITIPNNQVFNSVIKNLTRNPKMRAEFLVGIGYEDEISNARSIIGKVLADISPKILNDPPPIVMVDNLGASSVNLKVSFWFDINLSSKAKLKSHAMQLVKEALMENNISMPDDAREVVFASSLKIEKVNEQKDATSKNGRPKSKGPQQGQVDLSSEVDNIKEQAIKMPTVEKGENLIS